MVRRRRVHGDNASGAYAHGPNSLLLPPRLESGKIEKRPSNLKGMSLGALIDALMRAQAAERHEAALAYVQELIMLEPDEALWHERHGDILRTLDRRPEAAAAYRGAALRYEVQSLSEHGHELRVIAAQLDAKQE
jgi:predicted Zn-dependent protease